MIAIMSLFEALSRVADRELALAEGEILFRLGDKVRSIFLIHSGAVRLVRHLPHGPALTLQLAEKGAILAEASLFADKYHCDAVAMSTSRLQVAARRRIEDAVTRDPEIARLWTKHLAAEIQRARTQVEIISLKTVAERLDAWLALRGDLPPKGQWQRLASEIGVTPEALYRELARRR
ncbi:Crp/Fnr family transcriptional regulator [Inquilinus sp. OTU3971]|uniref:Crp/Fnr family transcriptional regulator n=1 Tax=Inquilinus sp. OTU3971 TaxID=3043855 RepID=UPI00313D1209